MRKDTHTHKHTHTYAKNTDRYANTHTHTHQHTFCQYIAFIWTFRNGCKYAHTRTHASTCTHLRPQRCVCSHVWSSALTPPT